jgi:hypothetical protein
MKLPLFTPDDLLGIPLLVDTPGGVLHLLNQTLIDWYSKRQATVETATYESANPSVLDGML